MAYGSNGALDAPDDADIEIGQRITNALIIKNISITTLSEETGIAYNTLRRSLKGSRSVSIQELSRIANTLNIQPSALLPASLTEQVAA